MFFVCRHNFILYWNFVELLTGCSRSILMAGTFTSILKIKVFFNNWQQTILLLTENAFIFFWFRRSGGDRLYGIFDNQLPQALKKLPFDRHLSLQNVRKIVSEADGYQPHLLAPEQGYRRLIEGSISFFRGPAEATVDAVSERDKFRFIPESFFILNWLFYAQTQPPLKHITYTIWGSKCSCLII